MENIKNWITDHFVFCVASCIFICCIIGGWLLYTASRTTNDYDSTVGSVEHLEKGIDRAGKRLESAQAEIANAEKHIKRADAVTGKLTERTERNKKSLTECEQLTDRMSKRTERIEGIIADIEQSNKSSGT